MELSDAAKTCDTFAELIMLTAVGGDRNLIAARDKIAALDAESRRTLRLAVDRLADLLDADAMDRRLIKAWREGHAADRCRADRAASLATARLRAIDGAAERRSRFFGRWQ